MFKKLVTNLPYSPGLLNQVGFYTKRLKQEEFVRRVGMIFAILALLVNVNLSLFSPEASVLASPGNDVVTGGIYGSDAKTMQDKAINAMNSSAYTKAIFDFYGISERDIRGTVITTLNTGDQSLRSVGRQAFGRGAEACYRHNGYSFCERSMYAAYSYRAVNVKALFGNRLDRIGNSDPWFALLESCGNMVVRVGQDESITIKKELSPQQGQSVETGDEVDFRLKIQAGENGALIPKITDTLPEHTAYVDHSPKDLFDKVAVDGRKVTLSGSKSLYGLGPNEERVINIKARILPSAPENAKLCNTASVQSYSATAVTNTKPCVTIKEETPEPMCVSLKMLGAGGTNTVRTFEATAKPDGATIGEYIFDFGDGETQKIVTRATVQTTTHTYEPGTYQAKVKVGTSVGSVGNSGSCVVNLTIDEPTPDPLVTCDYIKLVSGMGTDLKRTFEVSATPENGASISEYRVLFGDGSTASVANNSTNKVQTSHIYSEAGSYTARATAITSLGEVTNNSSCKITTVIDPQPEVCPYDSSLPKDSPECVKPPVCKYDETLEPNDPACVKPPVCPYDEALDPDDPNCVKPPVCEFDETLEPNDPECGTPSVFKLKTAENVTQNIENAHGTTANSGDTIVYTLITENDGTATEKDFLIQEDLADVLQYATLVDYDGGELSEDGFVVTWPLIDIAPGQIIEKTITVKIKSPIPSTPISASDPLAYDNKLENAYGNNVTINVPKTAVKQVETVVTALPVTGAGTNALVSTLFIGLVTYFYFRNRLVTKELGLIKSEFSGGVI